MMNAGQVISELMDKNNIEYLIIINSGSYRVYADGVFGTDSVLQVAIDNALENLAKVKGEKNGKKI